MRLPLLLLFGLFSLSLCAQIPSGYYNGTENKSGEELKAALNTIISGHTTFPYTSSSTDTWDILKQADADPNDPTVVIGIYSGFRMNAAAEYNGGSGWNREHVWAKSRGDFGTSEGAGTDAHHLRAADISTNSARSNRNFDYAPTQYIDNAGNYNGATDSYTDYGGGDANYVWEPRDAVKGDVARMIFYMAVRYEGNGGEPDLEIVEELQPSSSKEPLHARLSVLMEWHLLDPVDEVERNRNDIVYGFQNNRNPFIDHPEFVSKVFGTDDPCANLTPALNFTQPTATFASMEVNQTSEVLSYTITATDITGSISLTPPGRFEVSLTQDFAAPIAAPDQLAIPADGENRVQEEIFVRYHAPATTGTLTHHFVHTGECGLSETLQFTTVVTGAADPCDNLNPILNFQTGTNSFEAVALGALSDIISYSISASDIQEELILSPTENLSLSPDADFSTEVKYPGSLAVQADVQGNIEQEIYVRFQAPEVVGTFNESVMHTGDCGVSKSLAFEGTVYDPCASFDFNVNFSSEPVLFSMRASDAASPGVSYTVEASGLLGPLMIAVPEDFQISTDAQFMNVTISPDTLFIAPDNHQVNTEIFLRYFPIESEPTELVDSIAHFSPCGVVSYLQLETSLEPAVLSNQRLPRSHSLLVYPNPVRGRFEVKIPDRQLVTLVDMTGKVLLHTDEKRVLKQKISLLQPGVYLLKGAGSSEIFKLVIQ